MYLTNIEIVKVVGLVIYLYSMFIYLKELLAEAIDDRPKVFSEYFWYTILFIGGLVPVLNTIVSVIIIKNNKQDEQ